VFAPAASVAFGGAELALPMREDLPGPLGLVQFDLGVRVREHPVSAYAAAATVPADWRRSCEGVSSRCSACVTLQTALGLQDVRLTTLATTGRIRLAFRPASSSTPSPT
jgi:hypothetical protein